MADSLLTAPILRTAIGGLSDDIFTGIDGSFYSSRNINIRGNGKGISLNKALVLDSTTVITEKINEIIRISNGDFLAFGRSGGIYRRRSSTRVKVTTDSPAEEIYGAVEFNGYVYRTTSVYIHRILTSNISDDISGVNVISRHALLESDYHPLLVSMGDMYIGNGSRVDKVNILNVWEDMFVIETNATVKKINDLGGNIRIVTTTPLGFNSVYLWDGVTDTPEQTIPLIGFNIYHSFIFNGYNYLITNKGLGILDGYKVYPVKKIDTFNNNINSICCFDEKLYIGGIGGVYVFGNKNKNYPEVLDLALSSSNGQADDDIGAIYSDGTYLYVSWSNGSSYGIDKLSTTVYYTTGELVTRGYYANMLYEIKETISAMAGFKAILVNESIEISASIDGGAYESVLSLDSTTDILANFTEDILLKLGYFQYIQFKIELGGDGTTTPEYYALDLTFNNNLKR